MGRDATLADHLVVVDGVEVRVVVERALVIVNKTRSLEDHATITAAHVGCGDLTIEAAAGSYFFALGRQDATTGHARFDERYIVKTDDEAALRYWFGEAEADAFLATYDPHELEPYTLTVTPTEVCARMAKAYTPDDSIPAPGPHGLGRVLSGPWLTLPMAVTRVDEAVRAVATIAGRGARLAASWRERLAPLGLVESGEAWRTDERYALVVARGRARIRIDFPWRLAPLPGTGLRTRLAIDWPDDGVAVIWPQAWGRRQRPQLADARELALPGPWAGAGRGADALLGLPDLAGALTAAGVDWLVAGDRALAIGWDGIVDDTARLTAALALLARWADHLAAPISPYR